jgi:hypothetical protein
MAQEFLAGVHAIVEPLLIELGFYLDELDDSVDEGGRRGSVVFYRSKDSKIQIYYSSREREINAMIGPLDAPNEQAYTTAR